MWTLQFVINYGQHARKKIDSYCQMQPFLFTCVQKLFTETVVVTFKPS